MKEYKLKVYTTEEAFEKTYKWLKNDDTIQYDEYFQNIIQKCNNIKLLQDDSEKFCEMYELLYQLELDHVGYFKLPPEQIREEFNLASSGDIGTEWIKTHWFD